MVLREDRVTIFKSLAQKVYFALLQNYRNKKNDLHKVWARLSSFCAIARMLTDCAR